MARVVIAGASVAGVTTAKRSRPSGSDGEVAAINRPADFARYQRKIGEEW